MNKIKLSLAAALAAGSLMFAAASAFAADTIVDTALEGCKVELDAWCKDVTPGEGRILSCLAAREDKLSGRCEYALYQASVQLEAFVSAIQHVATECKTDLEKSCANIEPGGGRLGQCLKKNEATVTPACKQAMADTKMEVE